MDNDYWIESYKNIPDLEKLHLDILEKIVNSKLVWEY